MGKKRSFLRLRKNIGVSGYNIIAGTNVAKKREYHNQRYRYYDRMDNDSDISRALDLIAEHCTETDEEGLHFKMDWIVDGGYRQTNMVKNYLVAWEKLNNFNKMLFKIVRAVLKYGNCFLFRDPVTFQLYFIHPSLVEEVVYDTDTMEIKGWMIRDFIWNIEDMEIGPPDGLIRNGKQANQKMVSKHHILHFSMNEGKIAYRTDGGRNRDLTSWPFGVSWLEQVKKTYQQRELLESSILIHRFQRSTTKLVWYIDIGKERFDRAQSIIEEVKNSVSQSRNVFDIGDDTFIENVLYNPMSILEDFYLPVSANNRGTKVEPLNIQAWDDIPELEYFKKKMMSALRVPYAWLLPSGEGGITPSNGKSGTATQEEIEFSRFCKRLQESIIDVFDKEFKMYCSWRDLSVNFSHFSLRFIPPTDYEDSKRRDILGDSVQLFKEMIGTGVISTRKAFKLAFGWTDEDISENEKMIIDERGIRLEKPEKEEDEDHFGHREPFGSESDTFGGFGSLGGGGPLGPETGSDLFGSEEGFSEVGGGGDLDFSNDNSGEMPSGGDLMTSSYDRKGRNMLREEKLGRSMSFDVDPDEFVEIPDDSALDHIEDYARNMKLTLSVLHDLRKNYVLRLIDMERRKHFFPLIYGKSEEGGGGFF